MEHEYEFMGEVPESLRHINAEQLSPEEFQKRMEEAGGTTFSSLELGEYLIEHQGATIRQVLEHFNHVPPEAIFRVLEWMKEEGCLKTEQPWESN